MPASVGGSRITIPPVGREEFGQRHLPGPWKVDQLPFVSYGPVQPEKRVEAEAFGPDPEKVGASWAAVHRARSGQWS